MSDPRTAATETDRSRLRASLAGIYRERNVPHIRRLAEAAGGAGWGVALWALDAIHPDLASQTVGVGPGAKLPLLNEIVARSGIADGWLVVADDDVVFTRGRVVDLPGLCARARFDLAQPARSDDNSQHEFNVAHPITAARRFSKARATTFVEIGPLFVVGPRWWHRIVPFPDERGMGWGLELDWHELHGQGCRLGIVDAIQVAHVGELGSDYDFELHVGRIHRELEERGFDGWADVQHTLGVWRPWQRVPPWTKLPVLTGS